jgi:hypothetical protein
MTLILYVRTQLVSHTLPCLSRILLEFIHGVVVSETWTLCDFSTIVADQSLSRVEFEWDWVSITRIHSVMVDECHGIKGHVHFVIAACAQIDRLHCPCPLKYLTSIVWREMSWGLILHDRNIVDGGHTLINWLIDCVNYHGIATEYGMKSRFWSFRTWTTMILNFLLYAEEDIWLWHFSIIEYWWCSM